MDIAIIGGGITGLTTALALNKVGLRNRVFEKAPQVNAVGAGIWMAPNAMKVFDWLGIGNEIRNSGMRLQKVEITDRNLRPFRNLRNNFITDNKGTSIISIHRARLQSILYNKLSKANVFLNSKYISHKEVDKKVLIKFQDGEENSSLLLGADGINSMVRQALFSNAALRYSGQTCWRGVAKVEISNEHQASCKEAWGKHRRFGFSVIAPDEVYWFAVVKSEIGQKDDKAKIEINLLNLFKDFASPVKSLIESTPVETIVRNDITDLKRLKTWYKGRTCLLGDAAHASTPNMGQGGAQGVEDAYYISNILALVKDQKKAFKIFEMERRKKVDHIVNTSWTLGKLIHNTFGQQILKLGSKWVPDKVLVKEMQRLYFMKQSFNY